MLKRLKQLIKMREDNGLFPDHLDALRAAPEHHKLLFENELVRVIDTCIHSGETTELHVHQWPSSLYILSWSHFIRYDERGEIVVDSRSFESLPEAHSALWSQPLLPHWLENVGDDDLHIISTEIKSQ